MKPVHDATATVITTAQQRHLIEQLNRKHLEEGGSILAQVFPDGLRIRVLTPRQTQELEPAIAKAMGNPARSGKIVHSAFDKPMQGGAA